MISLNQLILVGRLTGEPKKEEKHGNQVYYITLAVQRNYKNIDGEYENDYIDCILWKGIGSTTMEYCHEGDVIGVKGRLQTGMNGKKKETNVIAEKITFLSSKKGDEEDGKTSSE